MSATPAQSSTSATPILNRQTPLPAPRSPVHSKHLGLLAAILAVAFPLAVIFLMIWSPRFLEVSGRVLEPVKNSLDKIYDGWTFLWIVVWLPVVLFAIIVVHEIGHLISGLLAGFRFVSIRVGLLQIESPFHVSFKRGPKTGASGYVQMLPVTCQRLRSRALLLWIGGPLANLITGTILLYFDPVSIPGAKYFAILSILVGAGNLVPFRKLSTSSDGKNILSLLRNDQQSIRLLSILQLAAELRNGTAPENLSKNFLAEATAFKDESQYTVVGYAFAYSAAWYGQSADEAAQLLETCLEYSAFTSPDMREILKSDAAVFQARKRKRIDLAEQWRAEIAESPLKPWLRLRVEAAILEAGGDIEHALRKLDEVERAIMAVPNQVSREILLRGVSRWKAELLPAITETASAKSLI